MKQRLEDERRYSSRISDWINKYGEERTLEEVLAMQYISRTIFKHYEINIKKPDL